MDHDQFDDFDDFDEDDPLEPPDTFLIGKPEYLDDVAKLFRDQRIRESRERKGQLDAFAAARIRRLARED